ncbi:MAG TPA: AMP-binding protein [Oscillospiraceae bacterium]|nr:AMP-binding protein [Oscillospiraceae bacterium]
MKKKKLNYMNVPEITDIRSLVEYGISNYHDRKFMIYFDKDKKEVTKTYDDIWFDIVAIGSFFLERGYKGGEKIAILGERLYTYEWMMIFYATLLTKNIAVPLDHELSAQDLAKHLVKGEVDLVFHSDTFTEHAETFKNTEGNVIKEFLNFKDYDSIIKEGRKIYENGSKEFDSVKVDSSDLATIVFTSGTTGKSKGVMLSHGNLASNVVAACASMTGQNTVGFLPLNHTFSWVACIFAAFIYGEYGFASRDYKSVVKDFKNYSPQNFTAVPLVLEKIYYTVWRTAKKSGREELLKKGIKISRFLMKFGIDVRRKIFKEVHEQLGGRLEVIFCGGAFLDTKLEEGLYDLGILVLNGYGTTECSPAVTANRLDNYKFGSVGLPLPCNEIKIHEPDKEGVGEIYVRGSNVMKGYYKDPEATAAVFDGDWFKTGDFGRIDEDGFLYYIGRRKNLIVLPNGKNISPEELEDKFGTLEYVSEVLVFAKDGHLEAGFLLDFDEFPDAREKLRADVKAINETLPMYKRIVKHHIRKTEFEKTTSLKIKRDLANNYPNGSGEFYEED